MDLRSIALGLAFALIWSSAFAAAHQIVAHAPAVAALALRFLISGILGIGLALALGQDWRLTRGQWRGVVIFGLCQNAFYLGLYWVAMQRVDAGLAAIIAASMPLVVAALDRLRGVRVPRLGLAGLVLGFAGVAVICGTRLSAGTPGAMLGLCILGVVALAVATIAVRVASSQGRLMMVVGLQMMVGAIALAPVALVERAVLGGAWHVDWTPALVMGFLYTVLIPGLLATLMWFLLVGRIGPTRAATFHFLNPAFGAGIAALLLGERFGRWDVLGVAIVTGGVLMVQLSRAR